MYISRLTLYGFKSFLKTSELNFGRGVTGIVGPNGCGKTNIVDAIRWVIGEQKARTLRADKTTDVIFNGTTKRKPLNIAEVSLIIHNVSGRIPIDYTDIEITRRIYRNGDSEYLLNRNICRLKDIRDLFIDTGMGSDAYSIIELKMIENILSENPQERKALFEEAAGVNKYRIQRGAALKKLTATEEDLVRVHDIIGEVDAKVTTLRRQFRQYERYQKISEDLIQSEMLLAASRIYKLRQNTDPLENKIKDQRSRLAQVNEQLVSLEQISETRQAELDRIEIKLNTRTEAYNQCKENRNLAQTEELVLKEQYQNKLSEFTRINEEITNTKSTIEKTKQRIGVLNHEEITFVKQLQSQHSQQIALNDKQKQLEKKYLDISQSLEVLQDKKYYQIKIQSERLAKENALKENIMFLENQLTSINDEMNSKQQRLTYLTGNIENLSDNAALLNKELREHLDRQESNTSDREEVQEIFDRQLSQKREIDAKLDRINNKIDFYAGLLESKEGFSPALQDVLKNRDRYSGIIGSLSELINIDEEYAEALRTVLENLSNLLIVETLEQALDITRKVEEKQIGKLLCLAMEALNEDYSEPEMPMDNLLSLAKLISCPKMIKNVANWIFGDIYVCEDENFDNIVKNKISDSIIVISKSGKMFDQKNIITSKSIEAGKALVFGREEKLFHFEKQADQLRLDEVGICDDIKQSSLKIMHLKEDIKAGEMKIRQADKTLKDMESQIKNQQNEIRQLELSINELKNKQTKEKTALNSYLDKLKEVGQEKLELDNLESLENEITVKKTEADKAKIELDEHVGIVQNFRVDMIKIRNKFDNIRNDKMALAKSLGTLEKRLKTRIEDKTSIKLKKSEMEALIERKKLTVENIFREEKVLREEVEKNREQHISLRDQLQETHKEIYKIRHQKEIIIETINKLELELSSLLSQRREIESILFEKYGKKIDLDGLEDLPVVEIAVQQRDRLKSKLGNIGTINMAVKDEYNQEAERLKFLSDQKNDLEEAALTVRKVIREIDIVARKQFLETYEKIKENFKNIFQIFFPGGSTDINLIGDGDPLDSRIEIFACPGGKKMLSLRMLSAGEKTLTAIALLFGIYQVKPSPFCILDEVDAPLDDANTKRFTKLLKTFSDNTQFIIVTHNKVTMSVADTLFGVTMGEKGVSQIVSVNLD
ncbi:MAG: chromosome segregation protein SMC [Candidatus Marinimicrobia bacterium]|nr:chromosome segregation protein SMC [Candidatus Neomarinimicrobiota bacterium]